ncbi:MAG: BrnT family toxin [Verrucomicrobiota bacterium]
MRLLPGDPDKQSLKDRGLTWEMILQAIESGGLFDVLSDTAHPGQVILAVDIGGYVHAVPCEFRGSDLRMITAFPSRKLQKIYHQ